MNPHPSDSDDVSLPDPYESARHSSTTIAERIRAAANSAANEADFRRDVAREIDNFAKSANIELHQRDEYTVASGRADTVYNRLVVEYKRPGVLAKTNNKKPNLDAIEQIVDYVQDVARVEGQRIERMAGVILDGVFYIFLRFYSGTHTVDDPVEVNEQSTEQFLKYLVSLSAGVAVIPENLVKDFGTQHVRTQKAIRALYDVLESTEDDLTSKLFEQWQIYFSEVAGYEPGSQDLAVTSPLSSLAATLGIRSRRIDPSRLIFAVHTYFALLMKLVAWLAVSPYMTELGVSFGRLASLSREALQGELSKLERGGVFRDYVGIRNFLEGDFFTWYLHSWREEVFDAVRYVIVRLADYDPGTLELNPEQTRDLLKKLYHYLLPREIRHDLGEYYTPDWLAELTLNRLTGIEPTDRFEGDSLKRILDPACGSGTFLVLAIKAIRKRCRNDLIDESETLRRILANVVGMDLNPLAVIAARTNYLLAIKDLLPHRQDDIEIPVYLADSILVPSKPHSISEFGTYQLRTAVGSFGIPDKLATRENVAKLIALVDECVHSDYSVQSFLSRCRMELGLHDDELASHTTTLQGLYGRILELHHAGQNGIWSTIIKNAFAPLFIGRFDYVIGNPPWINWQSLPRQYREETKPLWEYYGLLRGHEAERRALGRSKREVATLFTYVALHRYAKQDGTLAFVITQSVFKSDASSGFRRFQLPNEEPVKVRHVDDLVELQPFENAANRTAVLVVSRTGSTKYPIPYTLWQRIKRGFIPYEASLSDVVDRSSRSRLTAVPLDRHKVMSPWLTLPEDLVDVARKIIGRSHYIAYESANTGGANGIFWLVQSGQRSDGLLLVTNYAEGAKAQLDTVNTAIEHDLVFTLIRGRDVDRWQAAPSLSVIVPYFSSPFSPVSVNQMQEKYPKLYAYLKHFEKALRNRKDLMAQGLMKRHAFYLYGGVSDYTFSSYKVVWKYIASDMIAAVVGPGPDGRPTITDHRLMMVPTESEEEAHFVCALLNSSPCRLVVKAYVIGTQISTHVLDNISIPKYDPGNALHREMALLSARAHTHKSKRDAMADQIDESAAKLWLVTSEELRDIRSYISRKS